MPAAQRSQHESLPTPLASRLTELARHLTDGLNAAAAQQDAPPLRVIAEHLLSVRLASAHPPVVVHIGSSDDMRADASLPNRISSMVNAAFGTARVDPPEVFSRLTLEGQAWPNRVLHLAYRGDTLVGCCSSTVQPGWTRKGTGQWGLLTVAAASLRTGVASALVAAAEARLVAAGCNAIAIEYDYTPGKGYSERLRGWYEGPTGLGFSCDEDKAGFRRVCKRLRSVGSDADVSAPSPPAPAPPAPAAAAPVRLSRAPAPPRAPPPATGMALPRPMVSAATHTVNTGG